MFRNTLKYYAISSAFGNFWKTIWKQCQVHFYGLVFRGFWEYCKRVCKGLKNLKCKGIAKEPIKMIDN